ncbi:MAG: U32 family peptidase [Clostridia bacterium]|nr:U32 family peptidase [Clostridia bacterium]
MKRKTALPELLAPAGSFECLIAAIKGGADAIYIGGKKFGARAYAKNFDTEELARAVRYAHLHKRKIYVTLNTLVLDREMDEVLSYARELYRLGVDALIIADLGAISVIREHLPDLELHASTQMSVHNSLGADMAYELGCKRVVLARELSAENIRAVTEKCKPEIEVFLHGALCVCHSGQCLFSSMVGGRSGNRGECAQPCRLPYNGDNSYPLSLTDLCLANHIRELCDIGVASLKIEGRMKSADYVYRVTSIYRRLLDGYREATDAEMAELRAVFSRGGFTDKYFVGKSLDRMIGTRGEDDKRISREISGDEFTLERATVRARARIVSGERASLTLYNDEKAVTAYGDIPAPAESHPLTEEDIKARLSKMGATMLSLDRKDIELELSEGINLSPASLNALRRDAAEMLEGAERPLPEERPLGKPRSTFNLPKTKSSALFLDRGSWLAALRKSPMVKELDFAFLPLFALEEQDTEDGINGVYIPPVIMENEIPRVREKLEQAKKQGIMYALVGNLGHFSLAKEFGLIPFGDFRLNITSSYTRDVYTVLGAEEVIISPELTLPQARDIGGFTIHMGRIPLMLTERCFIKENFGCERCGKASLQDRMGERFPLMREFDHRNLILNSRLTYMGDKKNELAAARLTRGHFIFSVESGDEIVDLLSAYYESKPLPFEVRRLGRRDFQLQKDERKPTDTRKPQKGMTPAERSKHLQKAGRKIRNTPMQNEPKKPEAKRETAEKKLPLPRLLDPSHAKKPPKPTARKLKK